MTQAPAALQAQFPASTEVLDAEVLSGTWFVTRSSLPMWRTWANPSVTYAALPDGQVLDTVRSTKNRRVRLIVGLDTPLGRAGTFEWRGLSPLTRLVGSRWEVLAYGLEAGGWAVTTFERTPFTPAGLDIYTRAPYLLPDLEGPLLRLLARLPAAAPFVDQLFAPRHER